VPAAPPAERLLAARAEVERACDLLVAASPDACSHCENALQRAVAELTDYGSNGPGMAGGAGARSAARGLRRDVLRAARLLESLAGFYRGWECILGTLSVGYTAGGAPAPVVRHGRLYCRG
jgi:hypothetical protein